MTTKIAIHSTGTGACALTGKEESDGLTVTFEDGTLRESIVDPSFQTTRITPRTWSQRGGMR